MKYANDDYSDYGNSESSNEESSQGSASGNESFDPDFRMESVNVMDIPHSNEVENDCTENTERDVFQGEQDTNEDNAVERNDADGEELVPV